MTAGSLYLARLGNSARVSKVKTQLKNWCDIILSNDAIMFVFISLITQTFEQVMAR